MGKFIPVAIIAIVLAWGLAFLDQAAQDAREHRNYVNTVRSEMQLDRERQWNELQQQHAPVLALTGTIAQVALASIGVLFVAGIGYGVTLALVHAAAGIQFDRRYQMAQLDAERAVAIAQATYRNPLPVTNYSPHTTYAPRISKTNDLLPGDVANDEPAAAAVPCFSELVQARKVGKGNPLLIGYDQSGAAIEGSWLHLYSVGIGGATGTGKSWTAAFLLAQSMLHGARALVMDPHAGDPESLATRLSPLQAGMMSEPASDPRAILATVKLVQSELDRRKQGRAERVPWVVVADEFSALMRGELQEPLSLLVEAIAQEGRKLGVYAMCLGQNWKVSRSGGGELRDSLASAFVHRIRPNQARYLTGLYADDLPADLLALQPGTAYWLSTGGDLRRVTIPRCSADDLANVAALLIDTAPTMPRVDSHTVATDQPHNSHTEAADYPAPQKAEVYSAEEARVIALFLDGHDAAAIVKEVHGLNSKAGRPYMAKLTEVQAVVRRALQAGAGAGDIRAAR